MLSQEKIDLIKQLYDSGMSKTDISKKIPCSLSTVTKYAEKTVKSRVNEMIGRKFGKLTVLSEAPKDNNMANRSLRYICKCDCGNIIIVNGNSLRTGHTTSCGCSRKGKSIKDLTNQKFGKLTVLYKTDKRKNRSVIWHCKCECGKECDVDSLNLKRGHVKSCGCLKSWKEIEIESFLKKNKIEYKKEYTFFNLRGKRNPLRFDFAIFNNGILYCLIEYQGQQHYDKDSNWHTEELVLYDKMKKEYCLKNNIQLYELNKDSDIESNLKEILNI